LPCSWILQYAKRIRKRTESRSQNNKQSQKVKLQTKSLSQKEETGRTHHIFPDLEEQAALAALLKRKNAEKILTCKGRGKKTAKNSLEPVAETDAKTHNHEQKKKTRRK